MGQTLFLIVFNIVDASFIESKRRQAREMRERERAAETAAEAAHEAQIQSSAISVAGRDHIGEDRLLQVLNPWQCE